MEQLKIYSKDEGTAYELPKADLKMGGTNVSTEIQMAAGNLVEYVQGFRPTITATWDYFPAELLAQITGLIRRGGWFRVDYPDLDGADKTGYFKVTASEMGVYAYIDGMPYWHGLTLTFVSREVLEG